MTTMPRQPREDRHRLGQPGEVHGILEVEVAGRTWLDEGARDGGLAGLSGPEQQDHAATRSARFTAPIARGRSTWIMK